ncbi:MAG: hypothetical protein ACREIA_09245, partial [Opitutaceae bacterium]
MITVAFSGCGDERTVNGKLSVPTVQLQETPISVTEWLVTGTFDIKRLDDDILRSYGYSEASMTDKAFESFAALQLSRSEESESARYSARVAGNEEVVLNEVLHRKIREPQRRSVAYAATNIRSILPRTVILQLSAGDAIRIWHNGKQVLNSKTFYKASGPRQYRHAVPLSLKRGDNFILLRITDRFRAFSFCARIHSEAASAIVEAITSHGTFMRRRVLNPGDYISIEIPGAVPINESHTVVLKDALGQVIASSEASPNGLLAVPQSVGAGLYQVVFSFRDYAFRESCFIGPHEAFLARTGIANSKTVEEQASQTIDALKARMEILWREDNRKLDDEEWQAKYIFAATEIERMLSALGQSNDPLKDVKGLHIRAFKSSI